MADGAAPGGEDGGVDWAASVGPKAGGLPPRVEGCLYDGKAKAWVPRRALGSFTKVGCAALLRGYTHQVERARSGASTCKRCGVKIAKAEVRIGYPVKDHRGDHGVLHVWLHVKCARADPAVIKFAKQGDTGLRKKLLGFDALKKEERLQLSNDLLHEGEDDGAPVLPPAVPAARNLEQHPKPAKLRVEMLPFQAEGLGWMLAREADAKTRGGVLADEMGMGKTLQMISVLLAGESRGANLVVCPAAAMLQWRNEILRFVEPGALEVELYYGFDRRKQDFNGRDRLVVLTTYQTLEADYRLEVNRYKVACEWCGRNFLPEKLKYHQKYFCGPDAQRTERQLKQERNNDLKTQAVKRMKIGGTETNITLDPLNALRNCTVAALRTRLWKRKNPVGPEAETGATPLATGSTAPARPPKVLRTEEPSAAAAAPGPCVPPPPGLAIVFDCQDAMRTVHFRHRPLGIRFRKQNPRKICWIKKGGHADELGVRREWVMMSIAGKELGGLSVDEVPATLNRHLDALPAETPAAAAAAGSGAPPHSPPALASGGGTGCSCRKSAGQRTKVRWARNRLQLPSGPEERHEKAAPAPQGSQTAWGFALRSAQGPGVISLDSVGSDSDLELVGASCSGKAAAEEPPVAEAEEECASPETGQTGLPSRPPDSESEEEGAGANGQLDLSRSPLFRTCWGRVVLDEAHRIKGRTNSTAQAAFALRASVARWCLSGTPLQNRVGEVYSIIRFLRFYPYAHYFCSKRGCSCASLHYRFDAETSCCRKCGHTKMQHRSHFATTVSNPIKKFGFLGAGKIAMECLRNEVLDRILLRRTKKERHGDLRLPPMEIKIRHDALSPEETDFYQAMFRNSLTQFGTYVDKGTVLHNYAHVFDLIMRLRQAVDHPYLIVHGSLRTESGAIPTQSRCEVATHVCALCQDDIDEPSNRAIAQCGHAFHRDCVSDYLDQAPQLASGGIGCPTCFLPLTVTLEEEDAGGDGDSAACLPPMGAAQRKSSGIMQRIKTAEFKSSTKIEALMQEITAMITVDSTSKALVFSQFTSFLELIEWRLKRDGISCVKLLGSMSVASKSNIIISFQTDPSLKVLLISLKAGGEGLNLQAANHIFLMDPWWNPASELQAIQRAHRIGQSRPVYATRFVATDTIEEKIIELQEKKQSVFDCSVGNCNQALQRLTGDDIKFLFSQ